MGLTGVTGMALIFHPDLFESNPGAHPAQETVTLAHCVHYVESGAVDEAKVAGVERDFYVSDLIDQLVEK